MSTIIRDRKVSLTLSVPARIENEIARQAETRGLSRSALITELLIRALKAPPRHRLSSREKREANRRRPPGSADPAAVESMRQ
jgi:hypothetical protein